MKDPKRLGQKVAVIGSGISGLASAYFLSRAHDVALFEAADYAGGHTHTVDITVGGVSCAVDTGFLVFNEHTYPNLIALLDELGIPDYQTTMSFSVSIDNGKLEWAGTNLDTVFAQRSLLLSPGYWGMLRDIARFNSEALAHLEWVHGTQITLQQLLEYGHYGQRFQQHYLLPMAAAIWSSPCEAILNFPAETFLRFCLNHGLLQLTNRPTWRTIPGGARQYVNAILPYIQQVELNSPVRRVRRTDDEVQISTDQGTRSFDQVIFATHAPDTLAMLADASPQEQQILQAIRYQPNTAWLHSDTRLLPKRRKAWAAWNFLSDQSHQGVQPVCVSYLLNSLQPLPVSTPVIVTLNPFTPPDPSLVYARFDYDHPLQDGPARHAQQRLGEIQGNRGSWFAGAWSGYGFHEDGLKSALRLAEAFGLAPTWSRLSS